MRDWLWESWRLVRQIFPLRVAGAFVVGMVRVVVQPEWIQAVAGRNSVAGNLAGVAFGVFTYFPTRVEAPSAQMFLDLGMHRGPLLAYLVADPEPSLQSVRVIAAIIGRIAWRLIMLTLKVLGPGCANCRKLEEIARAAVASTGVEAQVVKVTDMQQIVGYGVLKTPGLVIDEKRICSGRIPSAESVAGWIAAAQGR